MSLYKLNHIVAAGTWDHFHLGHEQFLNRAFKLAEKVSVGITSDQMATSKLLPEAIEPYEQRHKMVRQFLTRAGFAAKAKLIKLNDIYGPALTDKTLEGLLVTEKTLAGGKLVNKKRSEQSLAPLQLIKVPLARAKDSKEISSERIRLGEIDRQGKVFLQIFEGGSILKLPDAVRQNLTRPFGRLLPGEGREVFNKLKRVLNRLGPNLVISVGDVVTKLLRDNRGKADLFIVDFKVERRRRYNSIEDLGFARNQPVIRLVNKAGTVSTNLAFRLSLLIKQVLGGRSAPVMIIEGEEDLAVLPVILAAPLNAVVVYGQPHEGVVVVEVTEQKKQEADKFLSQFRKVDKV